jgi:broad specificity phosphatase PhoE
MIVGIRHAQVWNPEGVVYARLPGFHLSDAGRADAAQLAASLAAATIAAVYASPLERAGETAAILAEPHGLQVTVDDRLVEWAFWVRWQGMPWSRIRERDPELLDRYAADPASPSFDEPLQAAADHPDALVLGVTHEAPLAAALLAGGAVGLASFHTTHLSHLSCVRLRPAPLEVVDVTEFA